MGALQYNLINGLIAAATGLAPLCATSEPAVNNVNKEGVSCCPLINDIALHYHVVTVFTLELAVIQKRGIKNPLELS